MRLGFSRYQPINRNYISNLDLFLQEFEKKIEATSKSRQAEEEKYHKIGQLRDDPSIGRCITSVWENF